MDQRPPLLDVLPTPEISQAGDLVLFVNRNNSFLPSPRKAGHTSSATAHAGDWSWGGRRAALLGRCANIRNLSLKKEHGWPRVSLSRD